MRFTELLKSALSSILSRKVRSFLTSLGVIIGVFAVAALLSVGEASIKQMNDLMSGLNANIISASIHNQDVKVSISEIEKLQESSSIQASAPSSQSNVTSINGLNEMQTTLIGTTFPYAKIKDYSLVSGRFILPVDVEESNNAAVLGQTVALKLFGHTDIIGERFMLGDREFTVVGVLDKVKESLGQNTNEQVIIPITTGQKLYNMGEITQFEVLATSADDIDKAKTEVKSLLQTKTKKANDYRVSASDDLNSFMDESNKTMMALLGGIGGISLLVSGIGIMNIMLVSVRERTREIGIRKAIGAKRKDILTQFLVESVALSVLGGVLGIALTFIVASPIGAIMKMQISPSISIVLISLIFSIVVGIVFGVYPAIKASKLRPVEALHYE